MAKEFVKHAKMQEHIVNIEQHQENDLKLDEFYIGGNEDHLFSLKNVQFNDLLRSRLLPHQEFLREYRENILVQHLNSRCCKFFFFFGITSNRLDITMAHRTSKQQRTMICLSVFNMMCGLYIILFGFCHGPEVTLDWMFRLLLQLIVSALLVRPMAILALSAILPTLVIVSGQKVYFSKLNEKKVVQKDIEMMSMDNQLVAEYEAKYEVVV